jgi:hypothetical protein
VLADIFQSELKSLMTIERHLADDQRGKMEATSSRYTLCTYRAGIANTGNTELHGGLFRNVFHRPECVARGVTL